MRWIIAFALLAACGDNDNNKPPQDAGMDAPGKLTGCLDKPGVPMAPNGTLPCDLIPPGLEL